jgi:hypothetical protein
VKASSTRNGTSREDSNNRSACRRMGASAPRDDTCARQEREPGRVHVRGKQGTGFCAELLVVAALQGDETLSFRHGPGDRGIEKLERACWRSGVMGSRAGLSAHAHFSADGCTSTSAAAAPASQR